MATVAMCALPACSAGGSVQQTGAAVDSSVGLPDTTTRPDRLVKSDSGVWELRIWFRAKGSRSEGQHGVLTFEGREVAAAAIGEERDTGLGRMKYYGAPGDRMPWSPTGWNYADAAKMMPSSWIEPPKPDSPQ